MSKGTALEKIVLYRIVVIMITNSYFFTRKLNLLTRGALEPVVFDPYKLNDHKIVENHYLNAKNEWAVVNSSDNAE